jgi:hydroxymethylbilane synthase
VSKDRLLLGTRGSPLAVWQAEWVKQRLLEIHHGIEIDLIKISTKGDRILDSTLAKIGGKGLFVKEIEEALISHKIDLAVHSVKDMTSEFPPGLILTAICEREDPRDALICRQAESAADLPEQARIGTSSLRRKSQILHRWPKSQIVELRGNVGTRLKKLETEKLDAVVMAAAALVRMGWTKRVTHYFSPRELLPAAGQGALGIETRADDQETRELLDPLDHEESRIAVMAERAFLELLEGGCQVPMAAYARVESGIINIEGLIASLDGKEVIRDKMSGPARDPEKLGRNLAETLLEQGGDKILREVLAS